MLGRKPGALPGATAPAQARGAGTFTAPHEALWAAARKNVGDSGGTRALVHVRQLHRNHTRPDVVAGITAALLVGAVSPDVVVGRDPQTPTAAGQSSLLAIDEPVVVSLAQRRLAELTDQLPDDRRPLPAVAAYDSLVTGTGDA